MSKIVTNPRVFFQVPDPAAAATLFTIRIRTILISPMIRASLLRRLSGKILTKFHTNSTNSLNMVTLFLSIRQMQKMSSPGDASASGKDQPLSACYTVNLGFISDANGGQITTTTATSSSSAVSRYEMWPDLGQLWPDLEWIVTKFGIVVTRFTMLETKFGISRSSIF